ncbi:MAG: hypothetical protein HKM89_05505 [Gemmatimonadales bacterium]|nr:hypothetical protein [Gemmatimonadales bacterium]
MRRPYVLAAAALLALGCGGREGSGSVGCGIAALTGPTLLLSEFSTPNQTLASPPATLPETLVARFAAGPAYPAFVGRTDTTWVVGVEGAIPEDIDPEFGVLVLGLDGTARGLMIYEGASVSGAPEIGRVSIGSEMVPLIGIQLDPAKIEDPKCPVFPDSVLP